MPKLTVPVAAVALPAILVLQVILPVALDLILSAALAGLAGWMGYSMGKAAK